MTETFSAVRRTFLLAGLAVFAGIGVSHAAGPQPGQPAPAFTATDSTGKAHRLADYKGRTVILEWTNHLCPYTVKHYRTGNMQKLQKAATSDGAVWLSVISSAPGQQGHVKAAKANDLTKSRDAQPTAVLLDPKGTLGRLYQARTTPHMFIIDKTGKIAYMGAIDSVPSADSSDIERATNYVTTALAAIKAGKSAAKTVTRPYGCSVKYGPAPS